MLGSYWLGFYTINQRTEGIVEALKERRKSDTKFIIISVIIGWGISIIPELRNLFSISTKYYLLSVVFFFLLWVILRRVDFRIVFTLIIIFANFSILYLSIQYGRYNNPEIYFFPTILGTILLLQNNKTLLSSLLVLSLSSWVWLYSYGYSLNSDPVFTSFEQADAHRICNLLGCFFVCVCLGLILTRIQKDYEKRMQSDLQFKTGLLKELHHRIKNNLNMVIDFIRLKSRNTNSEELATFVKETSHKILSISKTHEQFLKRGDLDTISLKGYIQDLIDDMLRSYFDSSEEYELELHLAEVTLDMDKAITVGLMLNEIITNIIKHAYPYGDRKIIKCSIENEGSNICIQISDEGKGLSDVDPGKDSTSIGVPLVRRLVRSLDGTMERNVDEGVKYHISFPT